MQTPYFLINHHQLEANLLEFKHALDAIWPYSHIAYSVKTNSLPWVLDYLRKQGVLAEVVSDEEYALSQLSGYSEMEIVFNGPIKGEAAFLKVVKEGSLVNIDSQNELDYFRKHCQEHKETIGLRINVNTTLFESQDVGYREDGFRFGFSEANGELAQAIDLIRFNHSSNRIALHFHCNSVTRSVRVYKEMARYAIYNSQICYQSFLYRYWRRLFWRCGREADSDC